MSEIGLAEIFSMAEAAALVATLFVILYFSRKQAHSLSVDIETKVLNDLEERRQVITQMAFEHPSNPHLALSWLIRRRESDPAYESCNR